MKKFMLLIAVLCAATWATADEISFSVVGTITNIANVFSGMPGMTAGPGLNIVVSDTQHHLQFPLTGIFNASTGPASAITSTATIYDATFDAGGSVTIASGSTVFVAGSPVFTGSHLESLFSDDTGSYRGEFLVTAVDPAVLAMFHLGPQWKPDGAISLTFAQSDVDGNSLSAVLGAATVTVETPAPVPEATTFMLFACGVGLILARQAHKGFDNPR